MPRPRGVNQSRGKSIAHVTSVGVPKITTLNFEREAPRDRRGTDSTTSTALREPVTCPECGAPVRPVPAAFADPDAGIRARKTFIYPNHRPGGGRYSARRGDQRCTASLTKESDLP